MTFFTDELSLQDDTTDHLEPAPINNRDILAEVGLCGHEIRQILPCLASSDAGGPVWKFE